MSTRPKLRHQTFSKYKTDSNKEVNKNDTNPNNVKYFDNKFELIENKFYDNFYNNFALLSFKNDLFEKEIKNIEIDFKKLKKTHIRDDVAIINYIKEKEKSLNSSKDMENKFSELLIYILQKSMKNETENKILKYYLLSLNKLVKLILPLVLNINDLVSKLTTLIQFEKKSKNCIIYKNGDICDKLYVIIKGNARLLRQKERQGTCTKLEYIQYLIILYLFQEKSLISKVISQNKETINITENIFYTLLTIFKFYKEFTYNDNFKEKYKSIKKFIEEEKNLCEYIFKLYNCPPEDSLNAFGCDEITANKLYEFYAQSINEINNDYPFIQKKTSGRINEKLFYDSKKSSKIKLLLDLYSFKGNNFRRLNELFNKINLIYEVDSTKIYESDFQNYLNRIDFEKNLKAIRKYDLEYYKKEKVSKKMDNILQIKYLSYKEVSILKEGNIFGENTIKGLNNKINFSIITKDECCFATITKPIFDISLKSAKDKLNVKNLYNLTKCQIFKGISMNYFLTKIFKYLKRKTINKGDVLFHKGDKREYIYFIIKGELEFSLRITISQINDIIKTLGGQINHLKLDNIFDDYPKLKKYSNEKKMDINFFSYKDAEVVGLDDITVKNRFLFDCTCKSLDKAELFELDYRILEDYIKLDKLVSENHENYINFKRNIIIKRILEKRNILSLDEVNRINIALGKIKKIKKGNNILDEGYLPMTFPDPIIKEPPPLNEKFRKIFVKKKMTKNNYNTININNNHFDIFNLKSLFTLDKYNKINEEECSPKKKSKSKSLFQNMIEINLHTSQENERLRQIKKFHFFDKLNLSHKYNLRIDSNLVNKRKKKKNDAYSYELNSSGKKYATYSPNILNKTYINSKFRKYFKKICNNPLIPDIINSRARKSILPFSSKISLKKHINKNGQIFYKQTSQKYIDKRSITTEPNFYKNNQHIFYYLLNEPKTQKFKKKLYNKSLLENKEINSKVTNKNRTLSHTPDNKIRNDNILNNIKNNTNKFTIDLFKNNSKNNGIIDILFLDNWEEKVQFERKFFYKNKK